jgi:ubiquinone biosynthesis protein Coq4
MVQKDTIEKRHKMSENNDLPKLEDMYKDTICYTYEVTMLVQVLAPEREVADIKLDRDGGYVSRRDVVFKDATILYVGSKGLDSSEKKDK